MIFLFWIFDKYKYIMLFFNFSANKDFFWSELRVVMLKLISRVLAGTCQGLLVALPYGMQMEVIFVQNNCECNCQMHKLKTVLEIQIRFIFGSLNFNVNCIPDQISESIPKTTSLCPVYNNNNKLD